MTTSSGFRCLFLSSGIVLLVQAVSFVLFHSLLRTRGQVYTEGTYMCGIALAVVLALTVLTDWHFYRRGSFRAAFVVTSLSVVLCQLLVTVSFFSEVLTHLPMCP